MTSLTDEVRAVFSDSGPLARSAGEQYQVRESQVAMAEAVAQALESRGTLVVEAGTGVGKTFAYLVPVLLSGTKVFISTATKSLQDQLFLRDLPRLSRALNLPVVSAMLKGRSSYLCLYRLELARHEELHDPWAVRALAKIEQWSHVTRTGDLAEMKGLDERSSVIPLVTSTRDNCHGSECPQFKSCHVFRARREAMAADVVVINHHLFFADLNLRDTGVAELLPSVDVLVFDEAHQLVETGVNFLGQQLGSAQLLDFCRDVLRVGLSQARGLVPWSDRVGALERSIQLWRLAMAADGPDSRQTQKRPWVPEGAEGPRARSLESLVDALKEVSAGLAAVAEASPDFARLLERAETILSRAEIFAHPPAADSVRWVEHSALHIRVVESPLDIRSALKAQIETVPKSWVFTSATLGDDASMSWFTSATGLERASILKLDSPFDYPLHGRLYVGANLPQPTDPRHSEAVAGMAARCAEALGGRTFVLTTTLRALNTIAAALAQEISARGLGLTVLKQGDMPKRELIERFMTSSGSILVGSQSFWEGIDVPGEALQCVLIDKLPFPPPNDPWVEARVRRLKDMGRNAFAEFFVAEAAISLKQGAGRLIRSETDQGLLVICDPRMATMGYGRRLKAALPPMTPLASEAQALEWLKDLRRAAGLMEE